MKKTSLLLFFVLLFGCIDLFGSKPTPPAQDTLVLPADSPIPQPSGPDGVVIIGSSNSSSIVDIPSFPTIDTVGYSYAPDQRLVLYFIYVGDSASHGDAILLKKGDFDMLIDAGPSHNADRVVDFLRSHNVDDIEVLVSTHVDPEHSGGFQKVIDQFAVEEVWYSGNAFNDVGYEDLIDELESRGAKITAVKRGDIFSYNGVDFEVLNPPAISYADPDNNAVVLRVINGRDTFLLTSDINRGAQGDMINTADVAADVLMLPSHGLGIANNNVNLLLLRVSPKDIIISGGPNDEPGFGGDRTPVLTVIDLKTIPYYENYIDGTIRIISSGNGYTITFVN